MDPLRDMIEYFANKLHEEDVVMEEFLKQHSTDESDDHKREMSLFLKNLSLEFESSEDMLQGIESTFLRGLRTASPGSGTCRGATPHYRTPPRHTAYDTIISPLKANAPELRGLDEIQTKHSFNFKGMLEGYFTGSLLNLESGNSQQIVENFLEVHNSGQIYSKSWDIDSVHQRNFNLCGSKLLNKTPFKKRATLKASKLSAVQERVSLQGELGVNDKSFDQGVRPKETEVKAQPQDLSSGFQPRRKHSRDFDDIREPVDQLVLQEAELLSALNLLQSMPKRHEVNFFREMLKLNLVDLQLLEVLNETSMNSCSSRYQEPLKLYPAGAQAHSVSQLQDSQSSAHCRVMVMDLPGTLFPEILSAPDLDPLKTRFLSKSTPCLNSSVQDESRPGQFPEQLHIMTQIEQIEASSLKTMQEFPGTHPRQDIPSDTAVRIPWDCFTDQLPYSTLLRQPEMLSGFIDTHLPIVVPDQDCGGPSEPDILRMLLPKPVKLNGKPGKPVQRTSGLEGGQLDKSRAFLKDDVIPIKGECERETQCFQGLLEVVMTKAREPSNTERPKLPRGSQDPGATCPTVQGKAEATESEVTFFNPPERSDLKMSQSAWCEATTLRKRPVSTSSPRTRDTNLPMKAVKSPEEAEITLKDRDSKLLETASDMDPNAVPEVPRRLETVKSSQFTPKPQLQLPSTSNFNGLRSVHLNTLLEMYGQMNPNQVCGLADLVLLSGEINVLHELHLRNTCQKSKPKETCNKSQRKLCPSKPPRLCQFHEPSTTLQMSLFGLLVLAGGLYIVETLGRILWHEHNHFSTADNWDRLGSPLLRMIINRFES
ncbi:hypothetical protein R1flu_007907 [Riccia fluitans]|uniref:Uncharacterized protein n=1 Tax=Riccia fluitans TaxID=41844 RepID=A0ABD1Z119_9MARC